ncbi:MAG: Lrp/AsnC family transcriptional regulator [Paeniglutamicibacter terrestris]|jgi:DNA-binding Lrp family transcriptional regulator|uniref:Lrp/AsnC family transcriptional regulator n=1 Tax=Paeniglutamicibacter terrestris TaxID=2723403 RepID=A0ABX1G4M5_9MICC|nr:MULTISPECIES: Lrp/AsnC family transcriptional regulator [Paeniglutamicibacter]ASN39126.1 AsnC family transcriptional regulator [Arthrobacter sp. 7749]NKG20701.1 Lrp/AsnC family transcriptional regulator [Paeniglutamicibacter terrestris]QXQ11747.1 Lrp/AsnC family transcriptional regulator [Paeniglutamicibacter sp. Y32M11]
MDGMDRAMLRRLQDDGRMTATALAEGVGLTLAPCHRRLRELENSGVIRGYRVDVDPAKVGLGFEALVFVTLKDRLSLKPFEEEVAEIGPIIDAQRLFGDPDFLLRVMAEDLPAYQRFYDDVLVGLPGVEKLTSTIVMKSIKSGGRLPI